MPPHLRVIFMFIIILLSLITTSLHSVAKKKIGSHINVLNKKRSELQRLVTMFQQFPIYFSGLPYQSKQPY